MSQNLSPTTEKDLGVLTHNKDVDEAAVRDDNRQQVKRNPWWWFGGRDYSFVSVDAGYPLSSNSASSSDSNLEAVADVGNVWQNDVRSPMPPRMSLESGGYYILTFYRSPRTYTSQLKDMRAHTDLILPLNGAWKRNRDWSERSGHLTGGFVALLTLI